MMEVKNSRIARIIPLLITVCLVNIPTHAQYGGGAGEPDDPYLIYTPQQMNAIGADANDWDKHFKLMADIDLAAYTGDAFNIIGTRENPFIGVFEGNQYSMSNFTFRSPDRDYTGLFGRVGSYYEAGEIRHTRLIDPNIDAGAGNYVGSLVGWLAGGPGGGTLLHCHVDGARVSGAGRVGGLVGWSMGRVFACHAEGRVSGDGKVGGLAGQANDVECCYADCDVSGGSQVGGLVGHCGAAISNCYAMGKAAGHGDVAGLVGFHSGGSEGKVINCYSTAEVSGRIWAGGLRGLRSGDGQDCVVSSFWNTETSGMTASEGGRGLTTAQLQDPNTFRDAGWDFVGESDGPADIWAEPAGGGYPMLWWQLDPLPPLPSFSGGTGEPNDPYLISTRDELNSIGESPRLMSAHFALINDIDLMGGNFRVIGSVAAPFLGLFDGRGHRILNFSHTTARDSVGLFGRIGEFGRHDGGIKDLALVGPRVQAPAAKHVGSLVGRMDGGTISGCWVEAGQVAGDYAVGGLIGVKASGIIYGCHSSCDVSGRLFVGGLVGDNLNDRMVQCYSTGNVTGTDCVGGLVGENASCTITQCYTRANVSGTEKVGGLAGVNNLGSSIYKCYTISSASGDLYVGGLVGHNYFETVVCECYSAGSVLGRGGGLIGWTSYDESSTAKVCDCFWDVEASGQPWSDGGTGKTTTEMQDPNSFRAAGWDFVGQSDGPSDIWAEPPGGGYPILRYQLSPPPPLPTFSGGGGKPDDPYLISTATELNSIGHNPGLMNAHFRLLNDIVLPSSDFHVIGSVAVPFTGVFDGNGKKVVNLNYSATGCCDDVGLFASVHGKDAHVKDLGLIDPNVTAGLGQGAGPLVGSFVRGTIANCHAQRGRIMGDERVGGLVGSSRFGTLLTSYSSTTTNGRNFVGGLVGNTEYGTILSCYARGDVSARYMVGGLAGRSLSSTVASAYSAGSVSGRTYVGGLVGYGESRHRITASFWDIETSGQTTSDGGTGKTTAQMQTESTFTNAGWDFVGEMENGTEDIWSICEGTNYPRLVWQIPVGDFVCPDGVAAADFALFAGHWLDENCGPSNDCCLGTDLDLSGTVDTVDLEAFAENWLTGVAGQ
ncbi:MAG: hypothetical protein JSU70_10505 [Phycisphaerales bacterium]|nr:MAG: hypothetical protein JSU70_10505 [Phycisphaerales bacterium]